MSRRRRGGGDRYKPHDLKRGVVRDGCRWPTASDMLKLGNPIVVPSTRGDVLRCVHGVPWRECTLCSVVR